MEKNWTDFKSIYGNMEGARAAFEGACERIFKEKFKPEHVSEIVAENGDGGIDVFIGELGIKPITVIQCKFFLNNFGDVQKSQIRKSFNRAITSDRFEVKEWILCIPRVINLDENSWWFKWKHRQLESLGKDESFIQLINGNELIGLLKQFNLYNEVFKMEDSIKLDQLHKRLIPTQPLCPEKNPNPNKVLFNNYTKDNEPFYLERDTDILFCNSLLINNVWLHGDSGVGKTALLNRNLIQKDLDYCYCDLSPINISNSEVVMEEILLTIEDQLKVTRNEAQSNRIKQISELLSTTSDKNKIIVIDELSVPNDDVLSNIADKFIKLVTHYNNSNGDLGLKFVISTISDPKNNIQNMPKASGHFQFIRCDNWDTHLSDLFDLINSSLRLNLNDYKGNILNGSKNSPRVLKNIIKKIIVANCTTSDTIANAISLTQTEIID